MRLFAKRREISGGDGAAELPSHLPIGRRRFLRGAVAAGCSICNCGISGAFAATEVAGGPAVDPNKGFLVRQLGDGLYWVTDGSYSTMFLVTAAGVVACDAPPTLGANYLKAIAAVTDKPVTHLIYSHEHVDHIAGASLIARGAEIVAGRQTADMLAIRNDPRRPVPTRVFDGSYRLQTGGETLELAYKGPNHSIDNIFIFTPRQQALMVVDVVYPGWMPYKNLGVAVDIPGFVRAHQQILAYDFQTLVAGHVSRPGLRDDVKTQVELLKDLAAAAERAYADQSFLAFLKVRQTGSDGKTSWDLHGDYEQVLVSRMFDELLPRWRQRLAGTETYLRDNCWAMLESYVVQGAPDFSGL
jgi:glyoxylase-like metal-dependent hydrolase (beta-lactamase superfamily II)